MAKHGFAVVWLGRWCGGGSGALRPPSGLKMKVRGRLLLVFFLVVVVLVFFFVGLHSRFLCCASCAV